LNLGYAQREKAVRLDDANKSIDLLKSSIENLRYATKHIDKEYQARAYYELSKAYYQLVRKNYDVKDSLEESANSSLEAVERSSDPKYQSWLDYIDHVSRQLSQ
jgi:hypothetical protein